jgi:hypothetical protein
VASVPAFAKVWREIVRTIASLTDGQGDVAVPVRVKITVPFSISAALGVYTG